MPDLSEFVSQDKSSHRSNYRAQLPPWVTSTQLPLKDHMNKLLPQNPHERFYSPPVGWEQVAPELDQILRKCFPTKAETLDECDGENYLLRIRAPKAHLRTSEKDWDNKSLISWSSASETEPRYFPPGLDWTTPGASTHPKLYTSASSILYQPERLTCAKTRAICDRRTPCYRCIQQRRHKKCIYPETKSRSVRQDLPSTSTTSFSRPKKNPRIPSSEKAGRNEAIQDRQDHDNQGDDRTHSSGRTDSHLGLRRNAREGRGQRKSNGRSSN